jgi:NAD-dependent dihydropyrimidine dehydrogenase PreA subunit
VDLSLLPHLYDLPPRGPAMRHLQSITGDLVVLASLYPRAAYWVLRSNGIRGRMGATPLFPSEELEAAQAVDDESHRTIWCIDLRGDGMTAPLVEEIDRILANTGRSTALQPAAVPLAASAPDASAAVPAAAMRRIEESVVPRWYPVIDFHRCENCLECLNFCLFGSFGLDEAGRIFVEEPDACRDGCPACSRICPTGAIVFPQHADPAIAGDPSARPAGPRGAERPPTENWPQGLDPKTLAEAERRRALADRHARTPRAAAPPEAKDDLDRLVDGLDQAEL